MNTMQKRNERGDGGFLGLIDRRTPDGEEEDELLAGSDTEDEEETFKDANIFSKESFFNEFDTIDWLRDATRDRRLRVRVDTELERKNNRIIVKLGKMFYAVQAWILLFLVASMTGFLAALIDLGVTWLSDTRFGYCSEGFWISARMCCREFEFNDELFCEKWVTWSQVFNVVTDSNAGFSIGYAFYIVLGILYAATAAIFVKLFAKWAAGSGISEVKTILGGFIIQGFASTQTLMVKCVGLVLSVGSGLNCGKEGPLVHVGICCAELFSRLFGKYNKNQGKKRELLSAAAAAGVSVAFGAPIGGVLFSLEEVSYYFPHKTLWRSFFCAATAAIVLMFMNPFHTGKLVIFEVRYTHSWVGFELLPFMLLAVLGGLIGAFFIKMNIRYCMIRKRTKLKEYPILETVVVSGITALISFLNPYMRGNASEIVANLFAECDPNEMSDLCNPSRAPLVISYLLVGGLLRLGLVIFTFGLRVPAGIFIPPLAIGASLGRALGLIVQVFQHSNPDFFLFSACKESTECISPGVYALVGAAAVLGGTTRMTVSLVVIIFELTGELSYILPVMLTVLVSKWVADVFGRDGIYDEHIELNKYPFLENKREYRFTSTASELMTKELRVLEPHGNTLESLTGVLSEEPTFGGYPIVNNKDEMQLHGYISRQELRQALAPAKALDLAETTACYFSPSDVPLHHTERDRAPSSVKTFKTTAYISHRRKPRYMDLSAFTEEAPLQVSPNTPTNIVFEMFKKMGLRYILVVDKGVLLGIITKKDILSHVHNMHNGKRAAASSPQIGPRRPRNNSRYDINSPLLDI